MEMVKRSRILDGWMDSEGKANRFVDGVHTGYQSEESKRTSRFSVWATGKMRVVVNRDEPTTGERVWVRVEKSPAQFWGYQI